MDSQESIMTIFHPATAICIQIDIHFTWKCITYGYLGTYYVMIICQYSIAHVGATIDQDSTRKPNNGLHFPELP